MANLPQNTGYKQKISQEPIANFPSLKKTMERYDPDRAARLFTPTSGIGQRTLKGGSFETGKPIGEQQPGKYQAIPDYVRFAKSDERGFWADPTEKAKIRNFPEKLGGGQYTVDPTQRDELIKSKRTLVNEKFNPGMRKKLLDGRPSSMFEIDHTIPLWVGGSDTLANVSVLDKQTHKRKTAAQAVPLTLLANGKINRNRAKAMAINWEQHDTSGLPDPDNMGGYVPLELAEKYAKKWEEDKKALDTSKYFGESFKEEMSDFGKGWLPAPIREFAKGLVGGGTAGIAPGTHASEDTGLVGSTSNLAGHLTGTITGLGLLSKGVGMGFRGAKTALGLKKMEKAAKGAKVVLDARKAAGIADEALVSSRLADTGKLTLEALKTGGRELRRGVMKREMARQAGLLGLWGQIGLTGIDITGQQEIELKDRMKQAMMDMAFGGLLGASGQSIKGYAMVGGGTATLSLIGGGDIQTAFKDAALMTALHGMGYKRSKRLGRTGSNKKEKIKIGEEKVKIGKEERIVGEEEAYKVSTEKFYDHVGNLVPRVRKDGEVPKVLKYEPGRIEKIKEYTGETNINNTAEAIDALYFKGRRDFERNIADAKGKIPEEKIEHELKGLEVARNELKRKTLPVKQQEQKTIEDLLSIGESVKSKLNDDEWRETIRKTKILNNLPFQAEKVVYENPQGIKFLTGKTAGTGYSDKIDVNASKNTDTIARKSKEDRGDIFLVKDPKTQQVMRLVQKSEIAKEGESGIEYPEHTLKIYNKTKEGEVIETGYSPQPRKFERGKGYGINQTPYEVADRLKNIVVSNKPAEMKAKLEKDRAGVKITEKKAEELFEKRKEIKKMESEEIYDLLKPQTAPIFYPKELNNAAISREMDKHGINYLRVDPYKILKKGFSSKHKEAPYFSYELTEQNWLRSIAEQQKSIAPKTRETEGVKKAVSKQRADTTSKVIEKRPKVEVIEPETTKTEVTTPDVIKKDIKKSVSTKPTARQISMALKEKPARKTSDGKTDFVNENIRNLKSRFEDVYLKKWETPEGHFRKLKEVVNSYNPKNPGLTKKEYNEALKEIKKEGNFAARGEIERIYKGTKIDVEETNPLKIRLKELKKKQEGSKSEEDLGVILSKAEKQEIETLKKDLSRYNEIETKTEKLLKKKTKTEAEKKELENLKQEQEELLLPYSKDMDVILASKYGLKLQEPTSYGKRFLDSNKKGPIFSDKFKKEHEIGEKTPYEFWGNILKKDIQALQGEKTWFNKEFAKIKEMEKSKEPYAKGFSKTVQEGLKEYSALSKTGEPMPVEKSWVASSALKQFFGTMSKRSLYSQPIERLTAQTKGKTAKEIKSNVGKVDTQTRKRTEEEKLKNIEKKDREARNKWELQKEEEIDSTSGLSYKELKGMTEKTPYQTKVVEDVSPFDAIFKKLTIIPELRDKLISQYNSLRVDMMRESAKFKKEEYREMKRLFEQIKDLSKNSFPNEVKKWKVGGKITLPNEGKPTLKDGIEDGIHMLKSIYKVKHPKKDVNYRGIIERVLNSTKTKKSSTPKVEGTEPKTKDFTNIINQTKNQS